MWVLYIYLNTNLYSDEVNVVSCYAGGGVGAGVEFGIGVGAIYLSIY